MNLYEQVKLPHKLNSPVILDLGANAGFEGKKMYDVFGPDAKVVFVEPLMSNMPAIVSNVFKWGMQDRSFIEHAAIFHSFGWECFNVTQEIHGQTFNGHVGFGYSGPLVVRSKLISDIAKDANIIKVDIEGKEFVILPELVRNPTVQILFVELHFNPPGYPNFQTYIEELLAGTQFVATGWFGCSQEQHSAVDNYYAIPPVETIGEWGKVPPPYVVIERRE